MNMVSVGVMDVYYKIREISYRNIDNKRPVKIDTLVTELQGCPEMIREYLTALEILELIAFSNNESVVLIS
jgi:hypothetical protein